LIIPQQICEINEYIYLFEIFLKIIPNLEC
jgi:hypothetical protein